MSDPQDAATIAELKAQLARAELENYSVCEENADLKEQRNVLQHLVYVGAATRRRFLEEANQRQLHSEYKADPVVIEAGYRAAHRTNIMADLSLFFADLPGMDREVTGQNFTKIYGLKRELFPTMPANLGDLNIEMLNLQCMVRIMENDSILSSHPAMARLRELNYALGTRYSSLRENVSLEVADGQ